MSRFNGLCVVAMLTVGVVMGMAVRVDADCADQGVVVVDPAAAYGPTQQCSNDLASWTCDTYLYDVLPYQGCNYAGSHPGYKCDTNQFATEMRTTWVCGSSPGSCPMTGPTPHASTLQDHVENECLE
jgi:hypothetical protein